MKKFITLPSNNLGVDVNYRLFARVSPSNAKPFKGLKIPKNPYISDLLDPNYLAIIIRESLAEGLRNYCVETAPDNPNEVLFYGCFEMDNRGVIPSSTSNPSAFAYWKRSKKLVGILSEAEYNKLKEKYQDFFINLDDPGIVDQLVESTPLKGVC